MATTWVVQLYSCRCTAVQLCLNVKSRGTKFSTAVEINLVYHFLKSALEPNYQMYIALTTSSYSSNTAVVY